MQCQSHNFELKDVNLNVKKCFARITARLKTIQYDYTKDIDFSPVENVVKPIEQIELQLSQIEKCLETGKNSKGQDIDRAEYEKMQHDKKAEYSQMLQAFNDNIEIQNLLKLRNELEALALVELITDTNFIKPLLKDILKGDIDKLDFEQEDILPFISEVLVSFFALVKKKMPT